MQQDRPALKDNKTTFTCPSWISAEMWRCLDVKEMRGNKRKPNLLAHLGLLPLCSQLLHRDRDRWLHWRVSVILLTSPSNHYLNKISCSLPSWSQTNCWLVSQPWLRANKVTLPSQVLDQNPVSPLIWQKPLTEEYLMMVLTQTAPQKLKFQVISQSRYFSIINTTAKSLHTSQYFLFLCSILKTHLIQFLLSFSLVSSSIICLPVIHSLGKKKSLVSFNFLQYQPKRIPEAIVLLH